MRRQKHLDQNSEIEIPAQDMLFVVGELIPDDGVDLPDAEHFDRGFVVGHNEYRRGNPAACSGEERRPPFSNKSSGMMQYP